MRKRNALLMSLVLLLFFGMVIPTVGAQTAVVSVEPDTVIAPNVGYDFEVNITIADVTGLYGFDIMLYWDNNLLECIGAVMTPPAIWTNVFFPSGVGGIQQNYNTTHGRYWNACVALPPMPSFNGSTVLAKLTFNATAPGVGTLKFLWKISPTDPPFQYPVKLADVEADPIPCTAVDGDVTVIPEFPAALIMPLFMVATLAAIILGKKGWSRKRRVSFVAE